MWHLSTKGFSFPLEKASNVNFLWLGTKPALCTAGGLDLVVVEDFDRNQVVVVVFGAAGKGVEHGVDDAFVTPSIAILYNKWLIFKQFLLFGYVPG